MSSLLAFVRRSHSASAAVVGASCASSAGSMSGASPFRSASFAAVLSFCWCWCCCCGAGAAAGAGGGGAGAWAWAWAWDGGGARGGARGAGEGEGVGSGGSVTGKAMGLLTGLGERGGASIVVVAIELEGEEGLAV